MSILAAVKDFGVFKAICSVALGAFVIFMFMPKGGGKGNSNGSSTPSATNTPSAN